MERSRPLPPKDWKVIHFADFGTSEEFVQQLSIEIPELVKATMIGEPERQQLIEAIATISIEGLMPAFTHLKKIRASVEQTMPELNRKQLYEDFTRVLWHSYKDLMPKAASLMNIDIGFIFQNDANFTKGVKKFREAHPTIPAALEQYLLAQREDWQNNLAKFRNDYLEHRKDMPRKILDGYYQPNQADIVFGAVWRSIADILVVLLSTHFPPFIGLAEIPIDQRSGDVPRRFRFVMLGQPRAENTD